MPRLHRLLQSAMCALAALTFAAACAGPASDLPTQPATPTTSAASGTETSVRPGINARFVDPALDPQKMQQNWEGESREIYLRRATITRNIGLEPGMAIADVGAGTGLFMDLFAKAVGQAGRIYAIDISEKLVQFMQERAKTKGLAQVEARLCSERSIDLPPASVDVVFVCDTYHHFEYPRSTLASIHAALRPGGKLVVVDFERIPGVSREWVLGHVRAGKEVFSSEIEAAGFDLLDEPEVGLKENYMRRFVRR